jgi:hypothetical protein
MMRPPAMEQLAPIRCFFSEIQKRIAQNDARSDIKFRLLGSIVGFSTTEMPETTKKEGDDDLRLIVKLDDGTALVQIIVTTKMVTKLKVQEGSLVECIAAVVRRPACSDPPAAPSSGIITVDQTTLGTFSLIGEQVAVISDANAETLRWTELCYNQEQSQQQGDEVDQCHDSQWLGYPTRRVTAEDLFRIIEYQCEFDACTEEDNDSISNPKKTPPKGVSTEQLKICFNMTSEQVQKLLNELQVRYWF